MTAMISTAFPSSRGAAGRACELIIARSPQTVEQLLVAVDFGAHGTQKAKIRDAILAGWLVETPTGTLDVTEPVRQHFAIPAPKEKYIGQIVEPKFRGDWRAGTLSAKNIPNRRGLRPASDAAPAWSVKPSGYGIKSIGGGE